MRKCDRLRYEALEATESRGHDMKRFRYYPDTRPGSHNEMTKGKVRGVAECRNCDAIVTIDTRPMPNDADIVGDAVAVDCED